MKQHRHEPHFSGGRSHFGGARAVAIALLVALGFGVTMAVKMLRSGDSEWSYILAVSLAAVVAMAIVAPSKFTAGHRGPGDWSNEVRELREKARLIEQSQSVESSGRTEGPNAG